MKISFEREKKEDKPIKETIDLPAEIKNLSLEQKIDRISEILMLPDKQNVDIKAKMDSILLSLEKQGLKGKKKKFRLSGKIRSNIRRFHKKNNILVFLLREGKGMIVEVTQMFKGMVFINNDWHSVPEESIFWYENKWPAIILPEWDLQALIPDKLHGDAVDKKRIVAPQSIILRALKLEEVKMKAGGLFAGKGLIWLIIGAGILLYIIFGG